MATNAPTWSRPHRAGAEDAQLQGIYRQLVEEWIRLSELPSIAQTLRTWAKQYPALNGVGGLPELLDRIDNAAAAETDEVLLSLVELAQAGQRLAGQVVLQAMLPKLSRMARTAGLADRDAIDMEERRQLGIVTFWDVLSTYPVARRRQRVAGNLALDTLHRLTEAGRAPGQEFPISTYAAAADGQSSIEELAQAGSGALRDDPTAECVANSLGDSPNPEGSLLEVVAWGVDVLAITAEEASLLVRVYAPAMGEEGGHAMIAEELGVRADAIRARCSRATRKLSAAVRSHAEGVLLAHSPALV